jgi:hypothetical protein
MKTEQEQAASDETRRAAGQTPADRLLERLAVLLGAKAGVEAVFGEPIMRERLTVIPVARVRWGFGGGQAAPRDRPAGLRQARVAAAAWPPTR